MVAAALTALVAVACVPPQVDGAHGPVSCRTSTQSMPIMGGNCLSAGQLASWYRSVVGNASEVDDVSIEGLAAIYIEEGRREGVRGDLAFVQSIVETGWFRFGGQVEPWRHNYAGIGAFSGNTPASFPDSRIGVRAQIQHLRAYADASVTASRLHAPLVDPRFHYVVPKGKAKTVGGLTGTWATSSWYANTIVRIYGEALDYHT